MLIEQNPSLRTYNTFGITAAAEELIRVSDENQLEELSLYVSEKHINILGCGSNVLLTQDVAGTILKVELKGISVIKEDENNVWLKVAAGEIWNDVVKYTTARGWGGIENLALIPGTTGAAPIQNIGAYGVEVKDTISSVSYWHWESRTFRSLNNKECKFGYRESIFKNEWKGQFLITSVIFLLNKKPVLHTEYGAIREALSTMNILSSPTVQDVSHAVENIRRSKLPDPAITGNAGSFFKNPTLPVSEVLALQLQHPTMPTYPASKGCLKIPAGWLIEQCGWKGKRLGDAGVHPKQALVLVNYGHASGEEIWQLSTNILVDVQSQFGIVLEREVQVW